MEWYTEWNDIKKMWKILDKSKSLEQNQRRALYAYLERKKGLIFGSRLGESFLKEYARILHGVTKNNMEHLQADVQRMYHILRRGTERQGETWENLYLAIDRDKEVAFDTNLGAVFLEIFREKLSLEGNQSYQELLWDFLQIEKIYCEADLFHGTNEELAAKVLTETEGEIFHTWLGHSFLRQLQQSVFSKKIARNKRRKTATGIVSFLFLVGMVAFLSVGIYVKVQSVNKLKDLQSQKKVIQETAAQPPDQNAVEETGQTQSAAEAEQAERPEALTQYREIAGQYPDFFGWVKVPGTKIDYPVMQSQDSGFYLDHDYTGEPSREGAVFVDAGTKDFPLDNLVVVYGHNMKNGNVFGELKKYTGEEFVSEHPDVYFDTVYGSNAYQIAAVLKTHILYETEEGFRYYQTFGYRNEEEFQECMEFIEENAVIETDEELVYGDELLMLSTCEYSQENGRLVIVAKKK